MADGRLTPVRGRVLVVDDSAVIRQLITVNLELEGYEVVTAVDGSECMSMVHGVRPEIITLDVVMPNLDGFSTAEAIRQDDQIGHLPIVMISASAQESDLERGREIGVDAYLTKPFDPEDLIRTVRELTGR